jgi:hypothetical protein
MKPSSQITDRAKRYRANLNKPAGKKRCTFCASRRNIDVDHITGNEADNEPDNLMYLCRSCNTTKGIIQAKNRIGVRTRQYNPEKAVTWSEFKNAMMVLLGIVPGDVGKATETIRATTPGQREKFTDKIEAANPFKSDAQRRKFFAMAERGEISQATLRKFAEGNPAAATVPTFGQYSYGVSIHRRGTHDEAGKIIHATPPATRKKYARRIAQIKGRKSRAGEVPF